MKIRKTAFCTLPVFCGQAFVFPHFILNTRRYPNACNALIVFRRFQLVLVSQCLPAALHGRMWIMLAACIRHRKLSVGRVIREKCCVRMRDRARTSGPSRRCAGHAIRERFTTALAPFILVPRSSLQELLTTIRTWSKTSIRGDSHGIE